MNEREFHPLANLFSLLEGAEFAALVEDIKAHGLNEPITLFEGKILDGRNRARACREAGVEPRFVEKLFDGHAEAVVFVISANILRRHITTTLERRRLIEQLLKAAPEQSDRQIAATAKVDHKTVAAARRQAEGCGEIPHIERRTDRKGRSRPAHRRARTKTAGVERPEGRAESPHVDPETQGDAAMVTASAAEVATAGDKTSDELPRPAAKGRLRSAGNSRLSISVRYNLLEADNSKLRAQVRRLEGRVAELEAELARLSCDRGKENDDKL